MESNVPWNCSTCCTSVNGYHLLGLVELLSSQQQNTVGVLGGSQGRLYECEAGCSGEKRLFPESVLSQ